MKNSILLVVLVTLAGGTSTPAQERPVWKELPPVPDDVGLAGPFVGVHNDALIVAGGANFPRPVWETDKVWHDRIYVLTRAAGRDVWIEAGSLPRPIAYGAAVTVPGGVLCMGGNDASDTFRDVFLLKWNPDARTVSRVDYPPLPEPCAFGAAATIGNVVYLAGGQKGQSLDTAMTNLWALDLSQRGEGWRALKAWPGSPRALNLTVAQHNGSSECLYVISGRYQAGAETSDTRFLKDVWQYTPSTQKWKRRADAPQCVMAGPGIADGKNHILVLGGADGSLFFRGNELRDKHPGFPKKSFLFNARTNEWSPGGATPANHVTTIAVRWRKKIVVPTGEVRPRVRSLKVWSVSTGAADQ